MTTEQLVSYLADIASWNPGFFLAIHEQVALWTAWCSERDDVLYPPVELYGITSCCPFPEEHLIA